jgi:hypothetical protein
MTGWSDSPRAARVRPWPQRPKGRGGPGSGVVVTVALVGLLLGASPAFADRGAILSPSGGTVLRAGDLVQVRWTDLPEDVEEMELLLSLDGGLSFPVQLTPQLDPLLGSLAWLVPNLAIPHASLRLRVGVGRDEIESAPTGVFSIECDAGGPVTGLRYGFGQWWVQESSWEEPGRHPNPTAGQWLPRCFDDASEGAPGSDEREPLVVEAFRGPRGGTSFRTCRPDPEVPLLPDAPDTVPQRR